MLWIIYPKSFETQKSFAPETMCMAAKNEGLTYKLFYHEDFQIKHNKLFYKNNQITTFPKVALMRCFNKVLMQFLEQMGTITINNSKAASTVRNKLKTYELAKKLQIKIPKTLPIKNHNFKTLAKKLSLPFVLKDNFGMQGKYVFLINNEIEYNNVLSENRNITFIAQKFIKKSKGKDIRLYVVGNKVVSSIMRLSQAGDFRSNISQGGTSELFDVPDFVKIQSLQLAKKIGLEICSIDFLFDGQSYFFCEGNSNAGFSAFFAHGINMQQKFMTHIKEKYLQKL